MGKIRKYPCWERLQVSGVVSQALKEFVEGERFTEYTMSTGRC